MQRHTVQSEAIPHPGGPGRAVQVLKCRSRTSCQGRCSEFEVQVCIGPMGAVGCVKASSSCKDLAHKRDAVECCALGLHSARQLPGSVVH